MRRFFLLIVLLLLPTPAWAQFDEIVATMKVQRAAKPTPMSPAQLSDMLNRTALQHPGWGMLRKDGGKVCPTPYPGITISCDWMMNAPTAYGADFIVDAENTAVIQVGNQGALQPGQEIIQPWPVDGQPPAPGPSPTPPSPQPSNPDQIAMAVCQLLIGEACGKDTLYAQHERVYADLLMNLVAIQGKQDAFSQDLKAHVEKTNKFFDFLKDPKTLTAIITSLSTFFVVRKGM